MHLELNGSRALTTAALNDLKTRALQWLRRHIEDVGQKVGVHTDLIATGAVDSVAFIELVEFIEQESGQSIDLSQVEANNLSSIDGLCAHLMETWQERGGDEPATMVAADYSKQAERYSQEEHTSCWGAASDEFLEQLTARPRRGLVMDVGCGTGRALLRMAAVSQNARFFGVEPAAAMRERAAEATGAQATIEILDGRFERLPVEANRVDYLYSIFAFHWTTDVDGSIRELERVLGDKGEMDLFFTGRDTGKEFTRVTTPIARRYLGLQGLVNSTGIRVHMGREDAHQAFSRYFRPERLEVKESYRTYHDTLDKHWDWWTARASAHFTGVPEAERADFEKALQDALAELQGEKGIPYTVHTIHVRVRR